LKVDLFHGRKMALVGRYLEAGGCWGVLDICLICVSIRRMGTVRVGIEIVIK
jgi:hypothetical protein